MKKILLNIQRFAASKSTTFTEPAITDEMISGNYTNLKIKITFSANNNVTYFNNKTLKVNVNGVEKSASVSLAKGGSVVKEFTFTNIVHDTEPKEVHWYWSCATGTSVLGTISQSGDRTLQTLYRIAEYTGQKITGDFTTPTTLTIYYDVYSNDYDYYFEFGNRKIQLNPTGQSNTETITINNNFFNNYPNQTSIPFLDFNLVTYDGDRVLGIDSVTKNLSLDPTAIPTISFGTITEQNETMQNLNWGVFVQNKSQLGLVVTSSGVNGSNIRSLSTTIENKTYSQLYNFVYNVITTPVITLSGTNTISSQVTDSRNRTNTATTTYNVVAYSNPSITLFEVQRCLSDGTLDKNGTYLKYSVEGSISPVNNNNDKLFRLGYKVQGTDNYTYVTLGTTYTLSISNQISSFTISSSLIYDIVIEAIDTFTTTAINRTIDVGFDLMNFNPSGKSMAIGKVSTATSNQELLEVALETEFEQNITALDISADDITSNTITSTSGSFTNLSLNGSPVNFSWTYGGEVTGSTSQLLPNGIKELYLIVKAQDNVNVSFPFYLPILPSTQIRVNGGYYQTSSYTCRVGVDVDSSHFALWTAYLNNTNVVNATKTLWYYR